jgi:Ferritin-like domain
MKDTQAISVLEGGTGVDRRKFLKRTSLAGLGVAGATFLGGATASLLSPRAAAAGGTALSPNDVAILNFALNLEYLEAEFYTKATTGKTIQEIGIPVNGVGKEGPTLGGTKVNFSENDHDISDSRDFDEPRVADVAGQIAKDEQEHVLLLRSVLGNQAIAKPEINLNALGLVSNLYTFLLEARAFEDVGVTAYGGAAPLIQSKVILGYAARILATEAEHVGNVRLLVAEERVRTFALDRLDILPPPTDHNYFSVNSQALTEVRTPSEVLAIVYASSKPGTDHGGFFPEGVNGSIRTV